MSDKNYSVILTVDLSCDRCQEKIKKVLCKHQDRWNIRSVVWDEKNNKITLTGPFCPHKLSKRLCRKACKVIKAIDIPDTCECDKEKAKPSDPPPATKQKPASPAPTTAPTTPAPSPGPEKPKEAPPPTQPEPKQEPAPATSPSKPEQAAPEPDPVPEVPIAYPPFWPMCGPWCGCGAGVGYGPCARGCRCGCGCGCAGNPGHVRPCHDGCRADFFCEESACRPM